MTFVWNRRLKGIAVKARKDFEWANKTRKYGNNDPYAVHTEEVAFLVGLFSSDEDEVIAALYHDHIEDLPQISIIDIALEYGGPVARMVRELTDVYTSERFPFWNRQERKRNEAIRLGMISEPSRLIKLADLFSNTRSIVFHDRGFARTYLKEKEQILKHMKPLSMRTKILATIVKAQLLLAKLYLKIADKTVDRKVKKK